MKKGELHYIQLGSGGGPGGGDNSLLSEITTWVQKNGTAVKESEYSSTSTSEAGSTAGSEADTSNTSNTSNASTVYRLDASDVS